MMASSLLLCGRLCIIIAVIILLFLPLTFSGNNINNNALAQTSHCGGPSNPNSVLLCRYESAVESYERALEVYSECFVRLEELNARQSEIVPPQFFSPFDASTTCGPPPEPPEPPEPSQPLDCNELQTCSTSAPNRPSQDPRRLECGYEPYNCPLKTMCDGRRCEVIDCGLGTCPICPPGLGNLIIKAWCSYKCYPTGGAIIIIPVLGRYLPSLPICI